MSNKSKFIMILLTTVSILLLQSIAYSAIASTMTIKGDAYARVDADIRITNFYVVSSTNATSSYEEFTKNNISSSINISSTTGTIQYAVEITNYSGNNMAITNITSSNQNINYELLDYELYDMLCDEEGKCNSFSKTIILINVSSTSSQSFTLEFEFQQAYSVTYINFTNTTYRKTAIKNETLSLDLSSDNIIFIKVSNQDSTQTYSYLNGTLNIPTISSDITIHALNQLDIDYTGASQTFTAPFNGTYKLELWGAQGGSYNTYYGGYGAYVTGEVSLTSGQTLYAFVGGTGGHTNEHSATVSGGYNGGGAAVGKWSSTVTTNENKTSGGGATHISYTNSSIANTSDINNILAIAAGGSGQISFFTGSPGSDSYRYTYCTGGAGGGIEGNIGVCDSNMISANGSSYTLANQTTYGSSKYASNATTYGAYGKGGNGYSGGGGGLYGGAGGYVYSGGGSSYIANSLLSNKYMLCYECTTSEEESTKTLSVSTHLETPTTDTPKEGNGAIRISLITKTT